MYRYTNAYASIVQGACPQWPHVTAAWANNRFNRRLVIVAFDIVLLSAQPTGEASMTFQFLLFSFSFSYLTEIQNIGI